MDRRRVGRPGALERGFTLMETLVALSVVATAVAIFVSMYGNGVGLTRLARDRAIAADAAQAQLALITRAPRSFFWEVPADGGDAQFAIKQNADDPKAGNVITPPTAMPADQVAANRAENTFSEFRWRAFGRQPKDKEYCEVTVVVTWHEASREEMLALSSAVPRSAVEGAK